MVVAAAPSLLVDVGVAAGAVTAVLTLAGLVGRSRPGRWLWRRLVGDPVSGWLDHTVDNRVAPVRAQLEDFSARSDQTMTRVEEQLDALSARTDQTMTRVEEHMHREEEDRAEIIARLDDLATRFDRHLPEASARDARLDAHDEALGIDTRDRR